MGNPFLMSFTGCQHHDDCFTCPFPDCFYDNPGEARKWLKLEQDRQALARVQFDNPKPRVAAQRLGVTVKTYYRMRERVEALSAEAA